jgi:hypothetical protein
MRRLILSLLVLFLAAPVFAQSGVTLPAGSNTLKSLNFKDYPGLGIYSSSAGVMFLGDESAGITCTYGSGCSAALTSATFSSGTFTSPILTANGTAAAPFLAPSSASTTGFFKGTSAIGWSIAGTQAGTLAVDKVTLGAGADLILSRTAAATFQLGDNAATGTDQTLKSADSTTADIKGSTFTVRAGAGTAGNAAGGNLNLAGGANFGAGEPGVVAIVDIGTRPTCASGDRGGLWYDSGATLVPDTFEVCTKNSVADTYTWKSVSNLTNNQYFTWTADAAIQFGSTVMPDAGTDGRFDVTTGSATLTIGVLGGTGASAQGTDYPIYTGGVAYVAQAEDQSVTRGHFLIQSGTAGKVNDSATVTTIGLNIAKALYSEGVTATINPAGCTGSAGCINTALDTPSVGPAGQFTAAVDVAALGWAVGQPVTYWNSGGTTPTGLTDGNVYWLVSVSTTKVTISATRGGAVVVPSSQGNDATQYLARLPLAAISIQ